MPNSVVSRFEILPKQRPECRLFSGSCLLCAQRQTLARGHRYSRSWPDSAISADVTVVVSVSAAAQFEVVSITISVDHLEVIVEFEALGR